MESTSLRRVLWYGALIPAVVAGAFVFGSAIASGATVPGIAHYYLGDGSPNDAIAGGIDGTIVGSVPFVAGKFGQAFRFDGSGANYIGLGTCAGTLGVGCFGTSDFTIAFWVKTTKKNGHLLVRRGNCCHYLDVAVAHDTGQMQVEMRNDSTVSGAFVKGGPSVSDGNWHHSALVRSGGTMRLYVDGGLAASVSVTGPLSFSGPGFDGIELRLGASQPFPGASFEGLIDDVQFYGRALAPADVQKLLTSEPVVESSDYVLAEGGSTTLSASGSDPDGGAVSFEWDLDHDGLFEASGTSVSFSAVGRDGPSTQPIRIRGTDDEGQTTTIERTITITNASPTPTITGAPLTSPEGTAITLGSTVSDPGPDTFGHEWTVSKNGSPFASGTGTGISFTPDDNGTYDVQLKVTDDDGGFGSTSKAIAVTNVAPAVGAVTGPVDPVALGIGVTLSTTFTDPGAADTHTATWSWDDGTTTTGTAAAGSASASHTYAAAGVYTVKVTIADDDAGTGSSTFQYVVIYSGSGFVTGGGWITSPAGAYLADPSLTGRANFGFVSKYLPGRQTPDGQTEFQFKAGNLNFHSKTYDWLVVSGWKSQYRGTGTINGGGSYGFLLTAYDGHRPGGDGTDRFRIKIWNTVTNAVVYDNRVGKSDDMDAADPQTIGGGNIVIHRD